MSVDRAAYWSRTLKSLVGKDVELIWLDGLAERTTVGKLETLGQNNARLLLTGSGAVVDVRYDLIRMVAAAWSV